MEKIKQLTSDNLVDNNIEALKQLFPTAFAEGKVVMEELQALLGDYVEKDKEYYEFNWAGKHLARQEANKVSTGTLRPCKEESKNWDDTQNLYIEGDNLEVLKLLQKTYSNKVKMIYIDPPYNTGEDFVYKDNYKDNLNNYLEISGQLDEDGKKLSANTEADGRYHSNWLNMMYARLRLARNLLTEDGVIFISINDYEQSNLKQICNEIFGEENNKLSGSPTTLIWKQSSSTAGHFSTAHEYILVYAKNKQNLPFFKLSDYGYNSIIEHSALKKISKANPPSSIVFKKGMRIEGNDITFRGKIGMSETMDIVDSLEFKNGKLVKDTEVVAGWAMRDQIISWLKGEDTKDSKGQRVIEFFFNKSGLLRYRKERGTFHPKTILPDNIGSTKSGSNDLEELMEIRGLLDYPKPINLIKYLLSFSTNNTDEIYVLDFFSGSSTTAHAVMALNAEDGGNRRCISVQLPEPTEEKSEAYKAGYTTIAEIGKERIRRAGAKIAEEIDAKIKELEAKIEKLSKELPTDETKEEIANLKAEIQNLKNQDLGFRVFKLDSSNIKRWDTAPESLEQQLDMFDEAIKSDRTEEDILYEILLKYGLDLTTPIAEKVVDGCTIYNVGFGSLYVCLSENIQPMVAQAIAEWHKEFEDTNPNVIFSDSGFNGNDAAKTNAVQTLRQMGIENVRSI